MQLSYKVTVPPTVEPVTLDQAKMQLRVDPDYEDAMILGYITAARQFAEKITNRAFFNQTVVLTLDHFPFAAGTTLRPSNDSAHFTDWWNRWAIKLPRPALVAITSISFLDTSNVRVTLDPTSYYVDSTSEPARIVPAPGLAWPYNNQYVPGTVQVTYVAGTYGDGTTVNTCPQTVCLAILMLVSHYYAAGVAVSQGLPAPPMPEAVNALLDSEKFMSFAYN